VTRENLWSRSHWPAVVVASSRWAQCAQPQHRCIRRLWAQARHRACGSL